MPSSSAKPEQRTPFVGALLVALALTLIACAASAKEAGPALPAWYVQELSQLSQGSGLWVADNTPFKGEAETHDAYAVEWRMTPDRRGLTGRLFGLAGRTRSADLWQFRIHWDAKQRQAIVQQFSTSGTIGYGTLNGFDRATLTDQTFTAPDGRQWRELHHAWFEGKVHVTRSFEWHDGSWMPKRSYRWLLMPSG